MKKIASSFLWVLLLTVLLLVCWGVTLLAGLSPWLTFAFFLGTLGIYFLIKFMHRLFIAVYLRSQLTHQDDVSRKNAAKVLSPQAQLVKKWKTAVATLRGSSIKRFGNPLYVLPWFMVIGKSGTGKTTALTRARLSSPIQKVSQSSEVTQTLNCDWWYFDEAVVMDCAGRYVAPEDLESDRQEWEVGLNLLARYRANEGLNGLVLAISADRLRNPDQDELSEEGRVIRERIEQLIRLFGKRFPIYILVTKCDQLFGLEEWVSHLSEESLNQSMGYLSQEKEGDQAVNIFLDEAFKKIGNKLKKLRIALAARSNKVSPELLLFPNEFEQLKPGLQTFLNACLGSNPYLESPFLRGLFFSSACQQGGVRSSVMGDLIPPVPLHQESNAGIFLHDFFGRVLPRDRHISKPAALVNYWNRVTQHLGLLAWFLLMTSIGILMSISFIYNLNTIELIRIEHPYTAEYVGSLEADSLALLRVRDSISMLERRNNDWKNKWMMPNSSVSELEARLKEMYNRRYIKFIYPTVSANVEKNLSLAVNDDSTSRFPRMILSKISAINIYQARQQGADLATLATMPQRILSLDGYSTELSNRINKLFISHIAWISPSDPLIVASLQSDQDLVQRYAFKDPNLAWLTRLDDFSHGVKEVVASDFWGVDSKQKLQSFPVRVAPAFTAAGKKEIDEYLVQMGSAIENGPEFIQHRRAFEAWYHVQRFLEWQHFVLDFPAGERALTGEAMWHAKLGDAVSTRSPYYLLIDRLKTEFINEPEAQMPSWLLLARKFSGLLEQAQSQKNKSGVVASASKFLGVFNVFGASAIKGSLDRGLGSANRSIKEDLAALDDLDNFLSILHKIANEAAVSPSKAYKESADFHSFSGNAETTALPDIYSATNELKLLHQHIPFNDVEDGLVWDLIAGPFHYVVSYIEEQTSCNLQTTWESNVLFPLKTATTKAEFVDQLYGEKGSVWAFVDGPAKPFLTRNANQFSIVQTMGYSVPFSHSFLPMLNGAVGKRVDQLMAQKRVEAEKRNDQLQLQKEKLQNQQAEAEADRIIADAKQKISAIQLSKFPLSITAQPTSVNPTAKDKPFATELTIRCAAGEKRLVNLNFPVTVSFEWDFGSCSEVDLKIKLNNLTLTKKYPSALGVVHFLSDFKSGFRQFIPDEFPEFRAKLTALGVSQIGLTYNFEGQEGILKAAAEFDRLEKLEKAQLLEKQRLRDEIFREKDKAISSEMTVGDATVIEIPVLKQIGSCWNSTPMQNQRSIEAYFKNLVNQKLN